MQEDHVDLLQALSALDRASDELSRPGPFGGERTVYISISESRTRALDFDNSTSDHRYEVDIRQRKGPHAHGHGATRAAAIRDALDKLARVVQS